MQSERQYDPRGRSIFQGLRRVCIGTETKSTRRLHRAPGGEEVTATSRFYRRITHAAVWFTTKTSTDAKWCCPRASSMRRNSGLVSAFKNVTLRGQHCSVSMAVLGCLLLSPPPSHLQQRARLRQCTRPRRSRSCSTHVRRKTFWPFLLVISWLRGKAATACTRKTLLDVVIRSENKRQISSTCSLV